MCRSPIHSFIRLLGVVALVLGLAGPVLGHGGPPPHAGPFEDIFKRRSASFWIGCPIQTFCELFPLKWSDKIKSPLNLIPGLNPES